MREKGKTTVKASIENRLQLRKDDKSSSLESERNKPREGHSLEAVLGSVLGNLQTSAKND